APVVAWDCARASGVFEAHQNSVRDATQGTARIGYSTPAYVSLDQPRSLTFMYSSGLVNPTGLVQMNVVDNTGDAPNRVSIRLRINGAWVTDELFFQSGPGATRVAASFDARSHASSAVAVTAVVRKYWADGRMQETSVATRAPVVNERQSTIGMGWVVAGLQVLTDQGDGVFITENGTGAWFWKVGTDADGTRRYASPAGDFTRVRWIPSDGAYWREYPDGSRVRFRMDGRMTEARDRFGNTTTYRYGPDSPHLVGVIDPLGKETILYYNCCALGAVQDPAERIVYTEAYGTALYRFREPDNTLALDAHFVQDAGGGWVLDTYWTAGGDRNVGLHTGTTLSYDAHGKLAAVTAPQVATTDAGTTRPVTRFRSLEAAVLPAAGTGTATSPAARRQPHEVRVEATDPRGHTTRAVVDPFGAPVRVEHALGRVATVTRDQHGRVMRTRSHTGHTVLNEYIGLELHTVIDQTTGARVDAEYEPVFHQPTHIWGTGVTEVWNTYDTNDPERKLLTTHTGAITAPATSYTYADRGRVKSVTDPEGHGAFYSYGDEAGANPWGNLHQTSVGTATGTYRRTTTLRYDAYGRRVRVLLPGNDSTVTGYDLNNRVTHSVGPAQDTTRYEHRPTGLYRVTDAKGQAYVFNRNLLGWVDSEIDPRSQYTYYGYDRGGNVTSMTNRRGQSIVSTYDALGRIETRNADGQPTTWSYDPGQRWIQASNAESTNRTEYNASGRATRMVTTLGGVSYTQDVAYDSTGRRRRMDVHGPWTGSRVIEYRYNARGQLDTLRNFAGAVTALGYNDDAQEEWRAYPSGMVMGRNYVSTHAPAEVSFSPGILNDRLGTGYHYGATGLVSDRLTRYNELYESGTLARRYAYDDRGWLTSAYDEKIPAGSTTCDGTQDIDPDTGVTCTEPGQWELVSSASWSYDRAGNRIDASAIVEAGNRLMAIDGWEFTYDADGNLTRKLKPGVDELVLSWNSLGQLAQASRYQKGAATYGYDAFGRRVRRTAPDGSVVRYLYDGDDLLMEVDGAGNPVREYTYLPGVDRPHSVRISQTGATYYYATDHPGNVIALIDGADQVVNEYKYGPWGEPELVNGTIEQPLGYAAREWDATSGLYQVRARWYDPQTGRFVSEDPIGLAGGINPYVYAENGPVNFTDPFGLCPETPASTHVVRAAADRECPILLGPIDVSPRREVFGPDYGAHGGYTPEYFGGSEYWPLGGGGSGGEAVQAVAKATVHCAASVLGLEDLLDVGLIASGQAIPGSKRFRTPGSSRGTSLAGLAATALFGDAQLPFWVPTISGGPGTGRRMAITGTKKLARFSGRAVPIVGWGLLALDGVQFGMCMAGR
ncbi:MAG TPA: RHS repeat-associated core domain-containing protein, partial [Longimicrobium sp.]|nr:RHS repeat-associated core domain-containing protein [Longimicrobium sp.]